MSLTVERAFGIVTLVEPQAKPRRRFGVPPRGPFDRESFALANCLLGNPIDAPCYELLGGTATFNGSAWVACVGAMGRVEADGKECAPNSAFQVRSEVSVTVGPQGNAVYIATSQKGRAIRLAEAPESLTKTPIRYFPLLEDLELPDFTVNPASNRAGIRLDGLEAIPTKERPSEPCCVGTIQLTPSGQLIVVGPDGPTIGGYTKIGCVIEADLDKLAHLRAGTSVKLCKLDWDNVMAADQAYTRELARRQREISTALISLRS